MLTGKLALVIVTLIGMAMFTAGIRQVATRGDWLPPLSIVGYLLGVLILGIVGTALLDIQLPLIDSTRAAILAVIVLTMVKIALTQLHQAIITWPGARLYLH